MGGEVAYLTVGEKEGCDEGKIAAAERNQSAHTRSESFSGIYLILQRRKKAQQGSGGARDFDMNHDTFCPHHDVALSSNLLRSDPPNHRRRAPPLRLPLLRHPNQPPDALLAPIQLRLPLLSN